MDAHLSGIRALELRLESLVGTCSVPARPRAYTETETKSFALHPEITRFMFELIAHALACDLTRVAAFQWPHSEGVGSWMAAEGERLGVPYRDIGSLHTLAHDMSYAERDDGAVISSEMRALARQDMANLTQWRSTVIAQDLLGRLLPDVLDDTLLVWSSEMSEGGTHSNRNVPTVIVQGAGVGAFRTGRWLRWGEYDPLSNYSADTGGACMNQLLVSICHAMGLSDVDVVGDPSLPQGPLEGLA
jgi:hypothetical protein